MTAFQKAQEGLRNATAVSALPQEFLNTFSHAGGDRSTQLIDTNERSHTGMRNSFCVVVLFSREHRMLASIDDIAKVFHGQIVAGKVVFLEVLERIKELAGRIGIVQSKG
jgi:hypothetical protein